MTKTDGKPSLDIVMGHAVHSVELLPNAEVMALDTIFPSTNSATSLEPEKLEEQRLQVKAWLLKNRLAIEEDGDVLKIKDALQIYPPYGPRQCISDNGIILGKVQELISLMPNDK